MKVWSLLKITGCNQQLFVNAWSSIFYAVMYFFSSDYKRVLSRNMMLTRSNYVQYQGWSLKSIFTCFLHLGFKFLVAMPTKLSHFCKAMNVHTKFEVDLFFGRQRGALWRCYAIIIAHMHCLFFPLLTSHCRLLCPPNYTILLIAWSWMYTIRFVDKMACSVCG